MSAQSIFDFERLARIELHSIVRQYLASHTTTQMVEESITDFLVNLQHNLLLHKYPEWSVETESKISSHHTTCKESVNTESPLLFSFADMASLLSTTTTTTKTEASTKLEQEELSSEVLPEESLESLYASNTYSTNREKEIANIKYDRLTNNLNEVDRVVETQCRHLLSFPDTLIALAVAAFTQCVQLSNEHEHTTLSILERSSLLIGNDNTANTISAGNGSTPCSKVSDNYINNIGTDLSNYKNEQILQSVVNSALRNFSFDKDLYFSRLADAFWIFALSQGISCAAYTQLHDQEYHSQQQLSTHTLQKEHSDCSYNGEHALHFTEVAHKQVVHTFVICAMQRGVWQCFLDRLKHVPFGKLSRTMSKECEELVIMENVNNIINSSNNMKDIAEINNTNRSKRRKFVVSLTKVLDAVMEGCTKRRRGLKSRTIHLHKISDYINNNNSNNKEYDANKKIENKISASNNQKLYNFDRWLHDLRGDANVHVICLCVNWQQTIRTLFDVCNSNTYEIRNEVFSFLRTMLSRAINSKGVTDKDALLANCLFHTICIDMTCHVETPRSLLKVIFTELITPLFSAYDNKKKTENIQTSNNNDRGTHEPSFEFYKEEEEKPDILNNDDDDSEDELDAKNEQHNTIDSEREQKDKTAFSTIKQSDTTKRIDDVVEHILHEWSSKDVVLSGSLKVNATIMNSVMYVMQAIHQIHQQKLPSKWLTSLLDGVHVRLECVRSPELRDAALIVSAAFASMFVEYEEIATGLMSNDQFAEALQGWIYQEELLTRNYNNNSNIHTDKQCYNHLARNQNHISNISGYFQKNNFSMTRHSSTDRQKGQGKRRPPLELVLQDSITLSQHNVRSAMLKPDEPYLFYTNLHQRLPQEETIEEQQYLQWSKEQSQELMSHEKDYTGVSKTDLVKNTEHDSEIETHLAHEMPSFGIQEHPLELSSNNNDIDKNTVITFNNKNALTRMSKNKWLQRSSTPTLTLRGCYNVLMGIGRRPQAQQHEIEEDNELGLTQLHNVLQLHAMEYCRFNQTSQTNQIDSKEHNFRVCIAELNNMTSMLIPFLVSVELHAPADVLSRLHHIRFMCLVYIIILCPRMALNALSNMVYGVNYGVAQRVWMIDAIGYAAFALAHGTAFCNYANDENSYGDKPKTSARNRSHTQDNIHSKLNSAFDNYDKEEENENFTKHDRLIYPPIPSITHHSQSSCCVPQSSELSTLLPFSSLGSRKKVAIVVSEGKKTRRWGYTVHPRESDAEHHTLASPHRTYDTFQHKCTHNMLSDYAENFIIVFLSKIETAPPSEQRKAHTPHTAKSFVNDTEKNNNYNTRNNGNETQSTHFSLEQHKNKQTEQFHLTEKIRTDKRGINDEDDYDTNNNISDNNNNNNNNNMDHQRWSYTTYHFWQTSDPYTPSSILRVIVLIVQSLSHVRHVISSLCARYVHFIIAVAHSHPHSAIRQLGWITLGEVMRAWCNAPPLFVATVNSESSEKNRHDGSKSKSTIPSSQANLPEPTSSQRNGSASLYEDHAVRLVHLSLLTPQGSNTT